MTVFYQSNELLEAIGQSMEDLAETAYREKGLDPERFGYVLLSGPSAGGRPLGAAKRADWACYPCSLVKVFFLVACQAMLENGRLQAHEDLDRAMRDMILWSSNTGTNYVIDLLTGTTGDTLLPEAQMREWAEARGAVNRFFATWDWPELAGINLCQKLMDDQRYGRERVFVEGGSNHNRLSPISIARLTYEIFHGDMLPPDRAGVVRDLLQRDLESPFRRYGAYQIDGYLASGLPNGSRVWSKAGHNRWTGDPSASFYRHDTLRAQLPYGQEFFLTVFTEGEAISEDLTFLPMLCRTVVEQLQRATLPIAQAG